MGGIVPRFTILRNRVYLDQVPWRDDWHPAPQPPLVDAETFEAVQALLDERGEDRAGRRMSPAGGLENARRRGRNRRRVGI